VVSRAYGGRVLRRLLSRLGYEPKRKAEPERIRLVKLLAEQLNDKATRFRAVVSRAVLLEQRVEQLETDSVSWEQRARAARSRGDRVLLVDVARICGRIEGQLSESRAELVRLHADEAHLRDLLTSGRAQFADLVEQARDLGDDVSGCLLYIDLTRPEQVPDTDLLIDDGRDFVARVIDGAGVH
jgi:hypothetical protein